MRHGQDHPGKIGNEPDEPDEQTEFMKILEFMLVLTDQGDRSPDGVNDHQKDRGQTGDAVYIEPESAGNLRHKCGPSGIANKTEPEKD